jgi:hypothetical protein
VWGCGGTGALRVEKKGSHSLGERAKLVGEAVMGVRRGRA